MKNIFNTLKTNSKKGFTLVEMIIVIVIIAILAAIAIPAMKGYIDDANEATAIANCRTALTASEATAPMVENNTEYIAGMEELLGAEAVELSGTTEGTVTGTYAEGTIEIIYVAGSGTEEINWTDTDGNTAVWEEGMSAPEIESAE